ncbi:hypothetical protein ACLE20_03095 [Rhizobium sp. YIM 134829]|uniref:hypothetical protein n=1 Tax=Rhizobium sp. YIM 134829 TaxID=3390453 RepID=UPI00397C71F0
MLYWLPRIGMILLVCAALAFGAFSASSDDVARTLMVVLLGLGLFSVTLRIFPPERY